MAKSTPNRRRGSETRRLNGGAALVRMSAELDAFVAAAAAAAGLSVAAWLRQVAVQSSGAPADQALPSEPPIQVSVDLVAVGEMTSRLSMLNGAVVQLTKTLRDQGVAALHGDAEALLIELRSERERIGNLVDAMLRAGRSPRNSRRRPRMVEQSACSPV